jgi:acyl carrier protein
MTEQEIFERVVKILTPYAKNQKALDEVASKTSILEDLKVNSARLVDVVLAFEDEFEIEVADEDVDAGSGARWRASVPSRGSSPRCGWASAWCCCASSGATASRVFERCAASTGVCVRRRPARCSCVRTT